MVRAGCFTISSMRLAAFPVGLPTQPAVLVEAHPHYCSDGDVLPCRRHRKQGNAISQRRHTASCCWCSAADQPCARAHQYRKRPRNARRLGAGGAIPPIPAPSVQSPVWRPPALRTETRPVLFADQVLEMALNDLAAVEIVHHQQLGWPIRRSSYSTQQSPLRGLPRRSTQRRRGSGRDCPWAYSSSAPIYPRA